MRNLIAAARAPDCATHLATNLPLLMSQAVQPPMPPAVKAGERAAYHVLLNRFDNHRWRKDHE
jgi:chromosome condensin MukBEF MukE localization factor